MVCLCAMPFNFVWLQIIFCSRVNETTLSSFLRSLLGENGRSLPIHELFIKKQTRWSNDETIIELGHRKISWFASVSQISYLPQTNSWSLATDKSRYFAQPRPIIVNDLILKGRGIVVLVLLGPFFTFYKWISIRRLKIYRNWVW